jgi:hypothetical protein
MSLDVEAYFRSITKELESLKDRVRTFIGSAHWLTDGEWKESVLRSVLVSRLPDTVKIGRGFILTERGPSTQCDILLYKASSPVLFREGDLVILPPEAVVGVIEVKTRLDSGKLRESVRKLADIGLLLNSRTLLGLFAYESNMNNSQTVLDTLQTECDHWTSRVDLLCLGCSMFVKWWDCPPPEISAVRPDSGYQRWHSYELENMAAGYFVTNVVDLACPKWMWLSNGLWFPASGKERYRTGEVAFRQRPNDCDGVDAG